jgi:S-adenosylmethionine-diacylglycerol 3-amino-3-carboxypropyl transferase
MESNMGANSAISNHDVNTEKKRLLEQAVVHDFKPTSKRGFLERLFAFAFRSFVYPQIWEDPEVDLPALKIDADSRIMTIASGGCNIMNYLTEGPAVVKAVDLNPAHVALGRLKITALKHLPDYESFFMFFGHADNKKNIENYEKYIAPNLDPFSRKYWEGYSMLDGRRINYFTKNLYQFGLLGRTITLVHILAHMYGKEPREILTARNMQEQKEIFDRTLGPLFDKPLVKKLFSLPVSLYGLGIPPSQFDELQKVAENGDMASLMKERLRRMACDFPIEDNYFAWQAFGKSYDKVNKRAIPRYLQEEYYNKIKAYADRVEIYHSSLTDFMESQPQESLDCYVFLDAQDWMNKDQLNALWSEVMRTARPGARVIFRTAGDDSPLPAALPAEMLGKWRYDPEASQEAVKHDRSSIYGGFHVYTLDAADSKNARQEAA